MLSGHDGKLISTDIAIGFDVPFHHIDEWMKIHLHQVELYILSILK